MDWTRLAVLVAGLVVLPLSIGAAISIGPVPIPLDEVWRVIGARLRALAGGPEVVPHGTDTIVWAIRAPRVLLSGIVGAGLAVVGVVVQALLRNPLADPYIIGISSGASLGAVTTIVTGFTLFGGGIAIGAFGGALVAFAIVFLFAWDGETLAPVRLILAGVAVAALFGSMTSFVVISASDEQVRGALYWSLGGFAGTTWRDAGIPALVVGVGATGFLLQGRVLNAIAFGEETAGTLGIDIGRFRLVSITAAALMTGVIVSVSGGIGFVALIIPPLVRLIVGGNNLKVLLLSALAGALFLIWVDVGARMIVQPAELPIGVITAGLGAPVFLVLLRLRARGAGGWR